MIMRAIDPAFLRQQLELADVLAAGRQSMIDPQDLPGRYGRVVQAVDRVLQATGCGAVLAGGWAVWRHGYVGRVTQDLEIVLPADRVEESLRVAGVCGFEVLPRQPGRGPKVRHKDTGIQVDVLPEGGRPGTASRPAPTTIPHPDTLGARGTALCYITLPALIALKIGAARARDEGDVIELLRANPEQVETIRQHLAEVHADYAAALERLLERAREQEDR
jgi:hypothetical protein